jgi:uncharacterized membrane protein
VSTVRSIPAATTRNRVGLRRRPRLRAGLIQLTCVTLGTALGLLLSKIQRGPAVHVDQLIALFAGISGGLIALISLVFALLFLVVQFASTTHSPRLTTFRDSPLVWRAFGMFLGTFAFIASSLLSVGNVTTVSVLMPTVGLLLLLVSLAVARRLQLHALNSLQLAPVLDTITRRARVILDDLYPDMLGAGDQDGRGERLTGDDGYGVIWAGPPALLRQIDVPSVLTIAERLDARVVMAASVGDVLWEDEVIMRVTQAPNPADEHALRKALEVGIERSLDQDPLFPFVLLNDIALRALSSAINDPHTAIQAVDAIEGLLRRLAIRELDVGVVRDAKGNPRVELVMSDWERFLSSSLDELIDAGRRIRTVHERLMTLLQNLAALCPPSRRPPLESRLNGLTADRGDVPAPANPAVVT